MPLQNYGRVVFVPRGRRLFDYNVIERVLFVFKTVLPCKIHAKLAYSVGISRAVRNGAYIFKIMKYAQRLNIFKHFCHSVLNLIVKILAAAALVFFAAAAGAKRVFAHNALTLYG